jgi:hypothetical protein
LNSFFYGNFIPIIVFHIITFYILSFLISRPNKIDPIMHTHFQRSFFSLFDYISQFPYVGQPNSHTAFSWLSCVCAFIILLERAQLRFHKSFQQISIMLSNTNISLRYDEYLLIWSLCGYFPIMCVKESIFWCMWVSFSF